MWFLCRFRYTRYVESGPFSNLILFFFSHVCSCDNKGSEILSVT